MKDVWKIGDFEGESRLISPLAFQYLNQCMRVLPSEIAVQVVIESGTQILPVSPCSALIPEDCQVLDQAAKLRYLEEALSGIGREYIVLNNTARSNSAELAVRRALEGYDMTGSKYIKLEVLAPKKIGGRDTLVPVDDDVRKAADELIKRPDGLHVIPYIGRDLDLALELQEMGAAGIRIYAGYIGLNLGLEHEDKLSGIIENLSVPVILEGGIGEPSHAQRAMELGAAAVLVNTAITTADTPVEYARQFKNAVEIGRINYLRIQEFYTKPEITKSL